MGATHLTTKEASVWRTVQAAALLVLMLVLSSTITAPARRHALPDLHAVNLRLTDVPVGFMWGSNVVHTDQQVVHRFGENLRAEGRVLTGLVLFSRYAPAGPQVVLSYLALFTTQTNARSEYVRQTQAMAEQGGPSPDSPVAWPSTLGDEHALYRVTVHESDGTPSIWTVLFHRGTFVAQLTVKGPAATMCPAYLIRLAHLVDARIQHAAT
jgi:hypothetical protein